jgi:hypothetical protein
LKRRGFAAWRLKSVGLRGSQLAWIAALGLTVLYGIIAIVVSLVAFHARDITS